MPDSLSDLARDLDRFAADRDWHKYHAPKNVASALIVEAGELLEHFQWMTEEQSRVLSPEKLAEVRGEMADVLLYLVQLGNVLGIDVVAAGREKLATRKTTALAEATLCTTTPALFRGDRREAYDRLERAVRLPRYGTDCYAYAMLAAGNVDLVVEVGLQPYDIVALIPMIAVALLGANQNFPFGGTTILIIVGVGLDTVKQIESQLQQRNYEGFLR